MNVDKEIALLRDMEIMCGQYLTDLILLCLH